MEGFAALSPAPVASGAHELSAWNKKNPEVVAGKFEALFYRMILKQAREARLADPLLDSAHTRQIEEMRDDELAEHLGARGNLGIKNLVLQDLEKRGSLLKPPSSRILS